MKKLLIAIGVMSLLAGVFGALQAKGLYTKPNCGATAVIECGGKTTAQLKSNYNKMDSANKKAADLAFSHYGISKNIDAAKKGTLKANGDIIVGGKKVAKNAQSVGRYKMNGKKNFKIGGYDFHIHSAKSAFLGYDTPVRVFFNANGTFKNAVADVCGNPIIADNVVPKPKPKTASCDYLKATLTDRTHYSLVAKATVKNGAKVKSYTFVIKDKAGKTVISKKINTSATKATLNGNLPNPGKYSAVVTIDTNAGKKTCKVNIPEIKPAPVASCDSLTAKKISRTQFQFTAAATAKSGATIKNYTFDFGDGKQTTTTNKTVSHTYAKPGSYTVKVTANTSLGAKTSQKCQTTVRVNEPTPEPVASCDSLTANKLSRTKYQFTATASTENGATIKNYTFDFGDGKSTTTTNRTASHTYAQPGNYTVKVTANTSLGALTNADCQTTITVEKPEPKKVEVCELETGKIITINEDEYDSAKHGDINDEACNPVEELEVCELETGKVITINKEDYDSSKHGSTNDEACNPQPEQPEQPEAPAELPKTGAGDFMPFVGLASLVASIGYYTTSRR